VPHRSGGDSDGLLLAIDLGTSSVKVVTFAGDGTPRRRASASYPLDTPRPGWAEADPEAWWRAVVAATREVLGGAGQAASVAGRIAAIGLSGQMHGVVLCRDDARPTRPAVSWADGRGSETIGAYRGLPRSTLARLANPVTAGMAGTTLAWLARHEPRVLQASAWALQPKDWLRLRLTGEAAAEPSDASGTLLYDLAADAWATDVAETLGIDARLLAPLRPSASQAGVLRREAAEDLGLPAGIPVATGAGDTPAALLGSGGSVGEAQLSIGTGAQLAHPVAERYHEPVAGVHLFRRAEETGSYLLAAVQNAGIAFDWAARTLGLDVAGMLASLDGAEPGCEGVTFLPYLTGERTPILDADARGGWSGLALRHNRDAMARSVLEGITFAIADAADAVWVAVAPPAVVRLAGGGSLDPRWRKLLATVLQRPLAPTDTPDASALGAARLAARAIGRELPARTATAGEVVPPGPPDPRLERARARFQAAGSEGSRPRRPKAG